MHCLAGCKAAWKSSRSLEPTPETIQISRLPPNPLRNNAIIAGLENQQRCGPLYFFGAVGKGAGQELPR
jgi:hypothetical protein